MDQKEEANVAKKMKVSLASICMSACTSHLPRGWCRRTRSFKRCPWLMNSMQEDEAFEGPLVSSATASAVPLASSSRPPVRTNRTPVPSPPGPLVSTAAQPSPPSATSSLGASSGHDAQEGGTGEGSDPCDQDAVTALLSLHRSSTMVRSSCCPGLAYLVQCELELVFLFVLSLTDKGRGSG